MALAPDALCEFDDHETSYAIEPLDQVPAEARDTWQRIPENYLHLPSKELSERIPAAKSKLGDRLVILGHHYQRDEIIRFADFTGDSYKLSKSAAAQGSDFIVFCGVHFMAETADVLTQDRQAVILPNLTAGCSMADMAPPDQVRESWAELQEVTREVVPVTYMNSAASLKALTGDNGGAVCTSSNAAKIIRWAFEHSERVFFFPDQHLGRNTALKMGIPLDRMILWDPRKPYGGHAPEAIRRSRMILWKGHCSVHTRFTVDQIRKAREEHAGIRVMVHPECTWDVVEASDDVGSTEQIAHAIEASPAGSQWAVGTEVNLVHRLSQKHPDKLIYCLDPIVCPCSTMYRIHPSYLLWVLEGLVGGRVVNRIQVAPEIAPGARTALDRMIEITEASSPLRAAA
ncbi:MAG: quinolinate synthase NadA [Nitrospirae bacterium]|nr:quinolinate synthase NadA [Nitrospirota bacterium]